MPTLILLYSALELTFEERLPGFGEALSAFYAPQTEFCISEL